MSSETWTRPSYGFVAKAGLILIAIWALANGLWRVRDILFIAFASILLAVFFSLLVDRLDEIMPRWLGALLTLILFLGGIVAFWWLAWPQVEGQLGRLVQDVPRTLSDAVAAIQDWWRDTMPGGGAAGEAPEQSVQQRLRSEIMSMVSGALPLLNTMIGALTGLVVMIFAAVFFVIEPRTYVDGFLHLMPEDGRDRVRGAIEDTGSALKRWIAGMSISMLVIGVASTVGLYLLGVPAALVLGLIAAFLVFIPFIGPTLSAIPAMAMALTVSPMMAVWVALLYFGIQLLESNFLTPMVMKEAVQLEPSATILFQLAMGVLFGFLGLFLAVPLFAALRVLVRQLYIEPLESNGAP